MCLSVTDVSFWQNAVHDRQRILQMGILSMIVPRNMKKNCNNIL